MTSIALTGATGYVGRFVVAEFQGRGMKVRALSRPTSDRGGFTQPVEWVTGDLRSQEAVESLVAGADALVHLAYEHVPGKYRNGEGDDLPAWLDANVGGSIRLFKAAGQAGVKRFIFLSSRAVFSRTEAGRVLDEDHPPSPDTHYGSYKLTIEDFLQDFTQFSDMQVCSIRATGVYGLTVPVERSKWWDIVQAVLNDQPVTSNRGGTEVHGADVARAIGVLLTRPTLDISLLHLSDLYVTNRNLVRLIQRFTGKEGELPAPAPPPSNVLISRHLADLGIQLGGKALFEETVRQLVEIAVRQSSVR
ncbi:MAG: NAD(P)-dependent oxidoreductase [Chloroflexi bacterium]|nr:NAD(P)-dependent oxidoreductase [Chloroflexota bacterium]MCC6894277.1 NAD(P)-dependent oxidoreductase [Anaerolineae bacterium]